MNNKRITRFPLFIIKVTDGSLNKGEFLMNRTKRLLIALLLGLLLATQIAPAGAALPMRCLSGCYTSFSMAVPSG
jgi:hypothetical protein